jgi:hypothetical protein
MGGGMGLGHHKRLCSVIEGQIEEGIFCFTTIRGTCSLVKGVKG